MESEQREGRENVSVSAVERGHEQESVRAGCVGMVGVALLGVVFVAMALMYWLTNWWAPDATGLSGRDDSRFRRELSPPAGVQPNQRLQREVLEREAHERLSSYGWVDRNQGVAHIPIDRAMVMLEAGGLSYSNQQEVDDEKPREGVVDDRVSKDRESAGVNDQ